VRNDRHGDQLEAVQDRVAHDAVEARHQLREYEHEQRRRQREADECRQRTGRTRTEQPERKSDLTARGTRQELRDGDELRILRIVDPAAPCDELAMKITDVRDRPAKRTQAELQEDDENLERSVHERDCPISLSAFVMTDTDEKLIAAAAIIGDSNKPRNGYNAPAAIGTPSAL